VLDQLKVLLKNATVDSSLDHQLRSDQVVFFLHLLGLDTTGHTYRPHSRVRALHFEASSYDNVQIGIHGKHRNCGSHSKGSGNTT
jgi:hypothetical protein